MSLEKGHFEDPSRPLEKREEKERREQKLKSIIEQITERLKKERVPLTNHCRIDTESFTEVYSETEIKRDQQLVREREKRWYPGLSEEEIEQKKLKTDGEKLEMLKTAVFDKFLGEDFIVVRTSPYDDVENKADNVILEKATGNMVCAFDEVGALKGPKFERKKRIVLERNKKEQGAELKYGIKIEKNQQGEQELVLGPVKNLPIFYLALPKQQIERGVKELSQNPEEVSDYEQKLFDYFKSSLRAQIDSLELDQELNPSLKERLGHFEQVL